jgi:hypothetical protein
MEGEGRRPRFECGERLGGLAATGIRSVADVSKDDND